MGLFGRLKQGLRKTKDLLRSDIRDLFRDGHILDDEQLEQLEGRLLKTDMGVVASTAVMSKSTMLVKTCDMPPRMELPPGAPKAITGTPSRSVIAGIIRCSLAFLGA